MWIDSSLPQSGVEEQTGLVLIVALFSDKVIVDSQSKTQGNLKSSSWNDWCWKITLSWAVLFDGWKVTQGRFMFAPLCVSSHSFLHTLAKEVGCLIDSAPRCAQHLVGLLRVYFVALFISGFWKVLSLHKLPKWEDLESGKVRITYGNVCAQRGTIKEVYKVDSASIHMLVSKVWTLELWDCEWFIKSVIVYLMVYVVRTWITVVILQLTHTRGFI